MKKQIKVLTAAALLTLGASFSALAAEKGVWEIVDGQWMCKNEKTEEYYDSEWCLSAGKEYYVDGDGFLLTSDWVDDGTNKYYVGSDGSKTINDWKLLVPENADDDADEEWFYFGSTGKMINKAKKTIDGKVYYFDEDGVMLTGWVDSNDFENVETMASDVVYTDENGARVKNEWVKTWAPDVEEEDQEEDNMDWYYIGSAGAPRTGKVSNIKGQTYFFGADGKMLSGWVASCSDAYYEIGDDDASPLSDSRYLSVYYCGDAEDGHMKKKTWIKEYRNTEIENADSDIHSQYWFWIQNNGEVFIPATGDLASVTPYTFVDGEADVPAEAFSDSDAYLAAELDIQKETYIFNANGEMKSGLIMQGSEMNYYGAGTDGAKKDGSQTIADENDVTWKFFFYNKTDDTAKKYYDYAGVNGNYSNYLYCNGLLVKAIDSKYEVKTVEVDGTPLEFVVNKSGKIMTSNKYEEDGENVFSEDVTTWTYADDVTGAAKNAVTR